MEKSKTDFFLFFCSLSDAFAKLLESGDLKSSSVRLEGVNMPFHHLLARICFHHHFSGTFTLSLFSGDLKPVLLHMQEITIIRGECLKSVLMLGNFDIDSDALHL